MALTENERPKMIKKWKLQAQISEVDN